MSEQNRENERIRNINNQNKANIITQLSFIIGRKSFTNQEYRYILNCIDHEAKISNNNETKEDREKRYSRFVRDIILHFIVDNDYREEQLQKLPYYNDL